MTKTETNDEIARLFRQGYKIKEIAKKVGLKEKTVSYRLSVIRKSKEVKRWWE